VDLDGFLQRAASSNGQQEGGRRASRRRREGPPASSRRAGGKRQPARCSRKTQDKFAIASMTKKLLHCLHRCTCTSPYAFVRRVGMHSQVLLSTMHVQIGTLDRCCEHQRTHLLHARYRMFICDRYREIYIYMCAYEYIYIYIYVYVHIYAYVYVYVSMYICMCMCMYMYIYIYVYACMRVYVYMYICICVCIDTSPCAFLQRVGMHSQVLLNTMRVQVCTSDKYCEHQRTHLLHTRYKMCICAICIHEYMNICIYIFVCYIHICVCMYVHVYAYVYGCIYVCMCMCMCMCMCIYKCIYVLTKNTICATAILKFLDGTGPHQKSLFDVMS